MASMPAPDDRDVPRTLLVDYAEVITVAQPGEAIEAMADLLGLGPDVFHDRYWRHRAPYDRGGSPRAFWSAVAEAELDDDDLLAELARIDVGSWTHLNPDTLEVLRAAGRRGRELAVFSNAPRDLAAAVAAQAEMALFGTLIFSSDLGLTKPDPPAFAAALRRLGRTADEVLFIDDRAVNVAGAREAGLRAVHFRSPSQLAAELGEPA
jgi:putative hydrolase of the HAD superfamily